MKFLDKIALNRLISIIASFIIAILKIFKPDTDTYVPKPNKKNRPIIDKLKNIFKNNE
jgi:hypothetical protein